MRSFCGLFFFLFAGLSFAQSVDLEASKKAQDQLNQEYLDPEKTILSSEDFESFSGLEFYPISEDFMVEASFIRTPDEKPFLMTTSTARLPEYVKYGELHFTLKEQAFKLDVYQSLDLAQEEEYADYLFLPFTDETNANGSYGGGRYTDLRIPESDTILLDFNRAYNPYCAYNLEYSCPVPPPENDLPIAIEAGVKAFHKD